jgi:NAD(P)-dependent dehydrogenase (short-subunit alcohol dehydrogenase family)
MEVALVARSPGTLQRVASELATLDVQFATLRGDSTSEKLLHRALDKATARFGIPEVVVYNAALVRPDSLLRPSSSAHLEAWAVNVVGALLTAAHLLPAMAERGSGTFIVTGGMPTPKPSYTSLSLGKAGVRTLVDLLAEEYGPRGVHAATVTIDGPIEPGTAFDPDDIADDYWRLHTQPSGSWERDALFGGCNA